MERKKLLDYISEKLIEQKKTKNNCLIVGIEGQGCCGKSVFADDLKNVLAAKGFKADIVSIDYFCNKRALRYSNEFSLPKQHYLKNFNYEYFENCILKKAKDLGHLFIDEYVLNAETDEFDKKLEISLDEQSILIAEGVFLYRNEFKKYYDYSILLQVGEDEQLKRATQRDFAKNGSIEVLMNKYLNRYIPAYHLYEELNNPLDFVDLILDNTNVKSPIIIKEIK
ncbi:hypothetical protein [Clostridium sp.]|uniref:hypothetical protein n=1 Tax=Clostridium sp. TaxID=1506 RepID=UPI00261361AF|nr:hypothetical protein [Clostridium sp.]